MMTDQCTMQSSLSQGIYPFVVEDIYKFLSINMHEKKILFRDINKLFFE
jgi:hypothetical protein